VLGDHVITQIIKTGKQIEVQTLEREEIPTYWGFSVFKEEQSFLKIIKNNNYDLVIATSVKGQSLSDNFEEIIKKWKKANNIILEFGAPNKGLFEIAKDEGFNLIENTDFILNIIPRQGTVTIRTEEALFATLSIFNLFRT